MSVTYKSIIDDAAMILNDKDNIRWSREELYGWVLLAKLKIALDAPFDTIVTENKALDRNESYQSAPSHSACSSLRVVRSTSGTPVKRIDRKILDVQIPEWRSESGSAVKYYTYDNSNPGSFSVYPRPSSSLTLEMSFAAVDSTIESQVDYSTSNETKYSVPDRHEPLVLEFVLFMAFLKDADFAVNTNEAVKHYEKYQDMLSALTTSMLEGGVSATREDTYTQTPPRA